jgi:GLPGLI family protein
MKTKILLFVALCFNLLCFSQEKVDVFVSYKLTYKLDSTSQNTKGENFILYGNRDKSMFLSTVTYVKDSLLSQPNPNLKEILLKYRTPNSYYIITEPQTNTVSQYQDLVNTKVYYSTTDKIHWKLENESKEIMNLKCRKATTELFGRKWIAWYSEEYSFQFGPYKFYGLPGLIVEIYDSKDDYHFTANLIKQKKNKLINFDIRKNYKEIAKDKFWILDTKSKYEIDPLFNDLQFDDPNVIPTMKKTLIERQKRENNPLELKH